MKYAFYPQSVPRRNWISLLVRGSLLFSAAGRLLAASVPLLPSKGLGEVLASIGLKSLPAVSDGIQLEIPEQAEDGALVPVTLAVRDGKAQTLYVIAENNPEPVLAKFTFKGQAAPTVSLRVKLNDSGRVFGLAQSDRNWRMAEATVRVAVGGCG